MIDDQASDQHVAHERHDEDPVVEDPVELGAHPAEQGTVIRALRPFADTVTVLTRDGRRWELWPEGDGLFAGVVPVPAGTDYRLELQYAEETVLADDPYRYLEIRGVAEG